MPLATGAMFAQLHIKYVILFLGFICYFTKCLSELYYSNSHKIFCRYNRGGAKLTLHHFIAANEKLPIGEFGYSPTFKPISELKIKGVSFNKKLFKKNRYKNEHSLLKVYETEEDAYGIDIIHLSHEYEAVSNKFTHPYIYEIQGYLHSNNTTGQRKSIQSLFFYIEEHISKGDSVELYSCLDGYEDEDKDESLDLVINLKTQQFGKHLKFKDINHLSQIFYLEDKQYILIKI